MSSYLLSHLQQLENESIHIIREVAAECHNPVMLYSIGKDSGVMLRLAEKAFAPAPIPEAPPVTTATFPTNSSLTVVLPLNLRLGHPDHETIQVLAQRNLAGEPGLRSPLFQPQVQHRFFVDRQVR